MKINKLIELNWLNKKFITPLIYYNYILSKAITFPKIQGLGQNIQDRSFSLSPESTKMVEEKNFYSNLIHADLCLMKRRLQFFNISYSFGDMSF